MAFLFFLRNDAALMRNCTEIIKNIYRGVV